MHAEPPLIVLLLQNSEQQHDDEQNDQEVEEVEKEPVTKKSKEIASKAKQKRKRVPHQESAQPKANAEHGDKLVKPKAKRPKNSKDKAPKKQKKR